MKQCLNSFRNVRHVLFWRFLLLLLLKIHLFLLSLPIGSMYAIYGNMDPINIPPRLVYIYIHTIHGSYGLWNTNFAVAPGLELRRSAPGIRQMLRHVCRWSQRSDLPPTCQKHQKMSENNCVRYVINGQSISRHHDISWNILNYPEISWNIMTYHEISWHIMKYHDISWNQPHSHHNTKKTSRGRAIPDPQLLRCKSPPLMCRAAKGPRCHPGNIEITEITLKNTYIYIYI